MLLKILTDQYYTIGYSYFVKYLLLSSAIIIAAITIPIESWAEYNHKWDELAAWKEVKNNEIQVLIIRDAGVSQKYTDIVEDTINSKDVINSGKKLFQGWNEGIRQISKSYSVTIPTLHVQSKLDTQDSIIIYLMDKIDNEGYDGYTNLHYDKNGNIKKAFVKIFNVNELNENQLKTIVRHELGHALGLGHTNEKNDLMQPIIDMRYTAISLLDLQALVRIY
ncbi:MAG: matrixin family metalloprotease [Nitrosarchaeum sp.]|nr:matrixin family metalloprotease [Nitrosarchaeum sp.]